jgi:hypothetical protein
MVELYKQKMAEMRKSADALGLKFDRVSEIVTEIMNDYGHVKQVIKEWEKWYQRTEEKLRHSDEERKKNNIIIFGLQERGDESYLETLDTVVKFLGEKMKIELSRENINYVTRLGRRRGERPILIKFTVFKKLEVWKNKRNLIGSKIRVDENLSVEDRKVRKELIPFLKDAKKWGHKAFLRKHALIVHGRTYDLSYLKENIQLEDVISQRDNPGKTQDMTL